MACEPLHSHAGVHQVNFEWRSSRCCRFVAPECFWVISFSFRDPCWNVKGDEKPSQDRYNASRHTLASRRRFEDYAFVSGRNHLQFECICSNQSSNNHCRPIYKSGIYIPRERDQPHRPSGQLSASQRRYEAGFRRHRPDAFSEWPS